MCCYQTGETAKSSTDFPPNSLISWHCPDPLQIPRLVQVFQVSGHAEGVSFFSQATQSRMATLISVFCSPHSDTNETADTALLHHEVCTLIPRFCWYSYCLP